MKTPTSILYKGKNILFLFIFLCGSTSLLRAQQQSVAIGDSNVKSNAVLYLKGSGSQGLIIPIVNSLGGFGEKGMIVYNSADNKVYYHNGTAWVEAGGGGSAAVTVDNVTIENVSGLRVKDAGVSSAKIAADAVTADKINVNVAGTGLVQAGDGSLAVDFGTTANKIVRLDATGKLPAIDGSLLTNLPAGGDITGVTAGTGLTGGGVTGTVTLTVDAGTTANKIVQLDGTGRLPAVDGSQLTNLPAGGDITSVAAGTGLTGGGIAGAVTLTVDAGTTANKIVQLDGTGRLPAVDGSQLTNLPVGGDITSVAAGTGLTGGGIAGAVTLTVDAGTTANKIVQLDGTGRLPAVDGSQLTNLPGDISAVTAGTGLTGGGTTGAVSLSLNNTGVTAGSYGTAALIPQFTIDAQGRVTAATTIAVADVSATNEIQNLTFGGTGSATPGETFPLNISGGTGVTVREGSNVSIDQSGNVLTIHSSSPAVFSTLNTVPKGDGTSNLIASSIFDNGSVGINTTTPSANLHVNGTTSGSLRVTNASSGVASTDGIEISLDNAGASSIYSRESGLMTIGTGSNGTLFLTSGGLVGINDNTPSQPLDVSGNVQFTGALMPAGAAGTSGYVLTSQGAGVAPIWSNASSLGWSLSGNTGTTFGTDFLGTTDAQGLSFKTNNLQRMFIDPSGRVTINVNNAVPAAPTVANAILDIIPSGTGIGNMVLRGSNANPNDPVDIEFRNWGGGTLMGRIYMNPGASDMWFEANGATRLALESTGDVGIGLTNPTEKLDVDGNVNIATGGSYMIGTTSILSNTGTANIFAGGNNAINNTASFGAFFGTAAGRDNTSGTDNTFVGRNAGLTNTTGTLNVYIGSNSGTNAGATTASGNTFVGYLTGQSNTTGVRNVLIGREANVSTGNLQNAIAIGYNATVNASNKVRLGDNTITVIEGQVAFTAASDRRLKKDIQPISEGLDFISKLKPVSYQMRQGDGRTNWGFIAQDIESVLGTQNAVLTIGQDEDRTLGLRYSDFVAPLVKSTQQLLERIEKLEAENQQLKNEKGNLSEKLTSLEDQQKEIMQDLQALKELMGAEAKATSNKK